MAPNGLACELRGLLEDVLMLICLFLWVSLVLKAGVCSWPVSAASCGGKAGRGGGACSVGLERWDHGQGGGCSGDTLAATAHHCPMAMDRFLGFYVSQHACIWILVVVLLVVSQHGCIWLVALVYVLVRPYVLVLCQHVYGPGSWRGHGICICNTWPGGGMQHRVRVGAVQGVGCWVCRRNMSLWVSIRSPFLVLAGVVVVRNCVAAWLSRVARCRWTSQWRWWPQWTRCWKQPAVMSGRVANRTWALTLAVDNRVHADRSRRITRHRSVGREGAMGSMNQELSAGAPDAAAGALGAAAQLAVAVDQRSGAVTTGSVAAAATATSAGTVCAVNVLDAAAAGSKEPPRSWHDGWVTLRTMDAIMLELLKLVCTWTWMRSRSGTSSNTRSAPMGNLSSWEQSLRMWSGLRWQWWCRGPVSRSSNSWNKRAGFGLQQQSSSVRALGKLVLVLMVAWRICKIGAGVYWEGGGAGGCMGEMWM